MTKESNIGNEKYISIENFWGYDGLGFISSGENGFLLITENILVMLVAFWKKDTTASLIMKMTGMLMTVMMFLIILFIKKG